MSKILLVGSPSDQLSSLNASLVDNYAIQEVANRVENVQGMVNIYKPEVIVLYLPELEVGDVNILKWLNENAFDIPVVVYTTEMARGEITPYCESVRYHVIYAPESHDAIIDKIAKLLTDEVEENPVIARRAVNRKPKVLIIDDSALALRNIRGLLQDHYETILAISGKDGLRMIPEEQPEVILLDYDMPEMDGRETYKEILKMKEGKDIPVIFLTSVAEKDRIVGVLQYNPAGYILKPPNAKKLQDLLEKVLLRA